MKRRPRESQTRFTRRRSTSSRRLEPHPNPRERPLKAHFGSEKATEPLEHSRFSSSHPPSVPRGVDFVSSDEKVHFSSVLVFHRGSRTIHVDDTLVFVRPPRFIRPWLPGVLRFHPMLAWALERRPGAAADFRAWAFRCRERSRALDRRVRPLVAVAVFRDRRPQP